MIRIENLVVSIQARTLFRNFSLSVAHGEKVSIIGASGKGKSTLFQTILGFRLPDSGSISIADIKLSPHTIAQIRKNVAWAPQEFPLKGKVERIIHEIFSIKANHSRKPSRSSVLEVFARLGLGPYTLDSECDSLSGGEKQRVNLAMVLLRDKKLLILDEPTSALDIQNRRLVADLILSLPNVTVLSASHDRYWNERCDRKIRLS